jgi:hypothetical protein
MNDEALHTLIEQWEALARQADEQTRIMNAQDLSRVSFYQGVSKTYRSAAQDLRDLIAPPDAPAALAPEYLRVSEAEAADVLRNAGLFTRSLTLHPDWVFSAVFSRLQPIAQESRVRQLSAADARIVILDQGTLRDSGDPFIDFAFISA